MRSNDVFNSQGYIPGALAKSEGKPNTGLQHGVTPEDDSTAMRTVERGVAIKDALAKYGITDAAAFFAEVDGTGTESEQ